MNGRPDSNLPARLDGLQVLRAVAAVGVVLFHANNYFLPVLLLSGEDAGGFWRIGQHGVELFFVLSGFLMARLHRGDLGHPARAGDFLRRRLIRIYPLYWAALALMALGLVAEPLGDARIGIASLARSLLLLPVPGDPVLRVAWTLQHEVMFYLAFALLIARPAWGAGLFAVWMAASAASPLVAFATPFDRVISPFNLCFGMGMLAAIARPPIRPGRARGLVALGMAIFLAGALGESDGLPWEEYARVAIFGPASVLLVLGLSASVRIPRPIAFAGDASYAVYLVHGIALTLICHALTPPDWLPAWVVLPLVAGLAIGAGMLAHVAIERPLRALTRSGAGSPRAGPVVPMAAPAQAGRRPS